MIVDATKTDPSAVSQKWIPVETALLLHGALKNYDVNV
jgi:hypothetical protein